MSRSVQNGEGEKQGGASFRCSAASWAAVRAQTCVCDGWYVLLVSTAVVEARIEP